MKKGCCNVVVKRLGQRWWLVVVWNSSDVAVKYIIYHFIYIYIYSTIPHCLMVAWTWSIKVDLDPVGRALCWQFPVEWGGYLVWH